MELHDVVEDAYHERLAEFGVGEDEAHLMLGYCHENAPFLAQYLLDKGISCNIVYGAYKADWMEKKPESIAEASEMGAIHFWVETESGMHIDIAIQPDGELFIGNQPPSNYVKFELLSPTLSPQDLLPSSLGEDSLND